MTKGVNPNSSTSGTSNGGGSQGCTIICSGTNSQGNHWRSRDYGPSASNKSAYHYSNLDGSCFYSNLNGSTYYNNGRGNAVYKPGNQGSY
ncbi:hypothetical protein LTS18_008878 [Coniosporium uncinatum]|uniref:Uncharacterized protein n=1 Tax=Coniosporium uncinatum TaxID=93489 RepID=A0ACC3DN59_9PEZI|nr:hypothetical protein LTS18_008878 [Coniosporium uncinatum]